MAAMTAVCVMQALVALKYLLQLLLLLHPILEKLLCDAEVAL